MADRAPRILLVDDEHSIQTLLSYPLRKDGYEVVQAVRRPRGAGPLRRVDLRPRRARRDDAADGRARGLPAPARPQLRPDHHAHREGRRDRQDRRPRARRRRLHHQAVLGPRVPQPREGRAAARVDDARADRRRRGAASRSTTCGSTPPSAACACAATRWRSRSSSSRSCSPWRPARAASGAASSSSTRVWGDSAYRDPRTVDVHIRHLREKLEADAAQPGVPLHGARRGLPLPRRRRRVTSLANRLALVFFLITLGAIAIVYVGVVPTLESSLVSERSQTLRSDAERFTGPIRSALVECGPASQRSTRPCATPPTSRTRASRCSASTAGRSAHSPT